MRTWQKSMIAADVAISRAGWSGCKRDPGPGPEDRGEEALALRKAAGLLDKASQRALPNRFEYSIKRRLLGPPMVNEQLHNKRLSKPLALGVLSSDGISSTAYGTEKILIEIVPMVGLAAFSLILPMTLVILIG